MLVKCVYHLSGGGGGLAQVLSLNSETQVSEAFGENLTSPSNSAHRETSKYTIKTYFEKSVTYSYGPLGRPNFLKSTIFNMPRAQCAEMFKALSIVQHSRKCLIHSARTGHFISRFQLQLGASVRQCNLIHTLRPPASPVTCPTGQPSCESGMRPG